eukprot:SAG11_NODE_2457_length_3342_cov_3.804194_2_plen_99_part_00
MKQPNKINVLQVFGHLPSFRSNLSSTFLRSSSATASCDRQRGSVDQLPVRSGMRCLTIIAVVAIVQVIQTKNMKNKNEQPVINNNNDNNKGERKKQEK